jgi:hypothetical protein
MVFTSTYIAATFIFDHLVTHSVLFTIFAFPLSQ